MSGARRRYSDDESALIEWAAWVKFTYGSQGWGGGVDRDAILGAVFGRISQGGPSNPVLSELLATEADGQDLPQRVHRHLLGYAQDRRLDWYRIPWLRYIGTPVATTWKAIPIPQDSIVIADGIEVPLMETVTEIQMPRTWKWSGLQTWEEVAQQTDRSVRSAKQIMEQVRERLSDDLRIDRRIVRGHQHPDCQPTPREIDRAERARAERHQRAAIFDANPNITPSPFALKA